MAGFQTAEGYKPTVQSGLNDPALPDNLNTLNTDKTKDMIMDVRRTTSSCVPPLTISGSILERAKCTKYLEVYLKEGLNSSDNTTALIKEVKHCLHLLCNMRTLNLKRDLTTPPLTVYYRGTTESIITSCITCWFGNSRSEERHKLNRIVKTAGDSIINDPCHLSHSLFSHLQSGRR